MSQASHIKQNSKNARLAFKGLNQPLKIPDVSFQPKANDQTYPINHDTTSVLASFPSTNTIKQYHKAPNIVPGAKNTVMLYSKSCFIFKQLVSTCKVIILISTILQPNLALAESVSLPPGYRATEFILSHGVNLVEALNSIDGRVGLARRIGYARNIKTPYLAPIQKMIDTMNATPVMKAVNVVNAGFVSAKVADRLGQYVAEVESGGANTWTTHAEAMADVSAELMSLNPLGAAAKEFVYDNIKSIDTAIDEKRSYDEASLSSILSIAATRRDPNFILALANKFSYSSVASESDLRAIYDSVASEYIRQLGVAEKFLSDYISEEQKKIDEKVCFTGLCRALRDEAQSRVNLATVELNRTRIVSGKLSLGVDNVSVWEAVLIKFESEILADIPELSSDFNAFQSSMSGLRDASLLKSGTIDEPIYLAAPATEESLVSYYAEAPDLTTDIQTEIVEEAQPVDPPPTTTWAGRMSLSGRYTIGLNPATGVVEAMEASGDAPVSQFILFNPDAGSMSQPIQGVQTSASIGHSFSHLMWGSWTGGSRQWTNTTGPVADLSGFFVYGELTPATSRTSGIATYTGRLRGDVIEDGGAIQRGLAYGDFGLTANFGTGALGGWLAIAGEDSTNYVFVTDITDARIVRQSDRLAFYGDLGANYDDTSGSIEGYFYGPNATELGGTYEVTNTNGEGSSHGILLGWETGTMPVRPAEPSGLIASVSTSDLSGSIWDSGSDVDELPTIANPVVDIAVREEVGGGTVTSTRVFPTGGYSYVSWGEWEANGTSPESYENGGYWVGGERSSSDTVRNRTGSASYAGEIVGDHVSGGVRRDMTGTIDLTANFNTDMVTGEMQMHSSVASTPNFEIAAPIAGDGGFTQHSDGSSNGFGAGFGIHGNFFGDNADEVGGVVWSGGGPTGSWNGVFRADQ